MDYTLFDTHPAPPLWLNKTQTRYIYGTGSFAQEIERILRQNGIPVAGFIDHRTREQGELNQLPIYSPEDPRLDVERRRDAAVVVGIHNREVNVNAILRGLEQLEFGHFITAVDLYDHFAGELGTRYWLTSRTYYSAHRKEIEMTYDLLSDDLSRKTFLSLLRFRVTGDYAILPEPDTDHQYFPPNLPAWPHPLRFVDCGAYDGDTLRSFLNAGYRFEKIAAFEPDENNFHQLADYVTQNQALFADAVLFPCGVYSSTTALRFETGNGEASRVAQAGPNMIQCVSLDECIPTFRPTLIKMDIEGAEVNALRGAEKLISDCQPALAISAYHSPDHLWEIPLLIEHIARQHHLSYTYHLRAHAQNCFDSIFYAIPARSS